MKPILITVIVISLLTPFRVSAQDACNVAVTSALKEAAIRGMEKDKALLTLNDPPKIREISCLDTILDLDLGIFFKIPNIGKEISNAIKRGCQATRNTIQNKISFRDTYGGNTISLPGGTRIRGPEFGYTSGRTTNQWGNYSNPQTNWTYTINGPKPPKNHKQDIDKLLKIIF